RADTSITAFRFYSREIWLGLLWHSRARSCAVLHAIAQVSLSKPRNRMPATDRSHQFALTLSCPSAAGQVAAVVGFLERHHCYVDELTVFDDDISARFFVRCVFHGVAAAP